MTKAIIPNESCSSYKSSIATDPKYYPVSACHNAILTQPVGLYLVLTGSLLTAPNITWQRGQYKTMIYCPKALEDEYDGLLKVLPQLGHFMVTPPILSISNKGAVIIG